MLGWGCGTKRGKLCEGVGEGGDASRSAHQLPCCPYESHISLAGKHAIYFLFTSSVKLAHASQFARKSIVYYWDKLLYFQLRHRCDDTLLDVQTLFLTRVCMSSDKRDQDLTILGTQDR